MSILPNGSNFSNHLLSEANKYTRRGWSIIATVGKRPARPWREFQTAPADEATLRQMFQDCRVTGIAVILGSASGGLACRDFDDPELYYRWAAVHPDLAAILPTVQTANGFHVYFLGPEGFHDYGNGEYRGTCRQYCLLPPSAHPDGPTYKWLVDLPPGALPTI